MAPVAYGLKFAGALSGGVFLQADFSSKLLAAGVAATAYAANLADDRTSVIVLNKDSEKALVLTLDFGSGRAGAVETETLHAPALESREAHITPSAKSGPLKRGKYTVVVPHATGLRLTLR